MKFESRMSMKSWDEVTFVLSEQVKVADFPHGRSGSKTAVIPAGATVRIIRHQSEDQTDGQVRDSRVVIHWSADIRYLKKDGSVGQVGPNHYGTGGYRKTFSIFPAEVRREIEQQFGAHGLKVDLDAPQPERKRVR